MESKQEAVEKKYCFPSVKKNNTISTTHNQSRAQDYETYIHIM